MSDLIRLKGWVRNPRVISALEMMKWDGEGQILVDAEATISGTQHENYETRSAYAENLQGKDISQIAEITRKRIFGEITEYQISPKRTIYIDQ